jgi:hypothetical protein
MAKEKNHLKWQDYLTAFQIAWKGGIISIDQETEGERGGIIKGLESNCLNPEEALLKKEALSNISEGAKEVLRIIMYPSDEERAYFTCHAYNKLSRKKIMQYLKKQKKWNQRQVDRYFEEVKQVSSSI